MAGGRSPLAPQTDASLNPGTSAGPPVHRNGEVVAIHSGLGSRGQRLLRERRQRGVGFADPVDDGEALLDDFPAGDGNDAGRRPRRPGTACRTP